MYVTRCRGAFGAPVVPCGEGMGRRMYRPFSTGKLSGNRALHRRFICAAASKKEEMKREKEAEEMSTPDSPPSKAPSNQQSEGTQRMEESTTVPSSNSVDQPTEQRLSAEEIASRMAELRAAAKEQGTKEGGLFEVRLSLSVSYFVVCLTCYYGGEKRKRPLISCCSWCCTAGCS